MNPVEQQFLMKNSKIDFLAHCIGICAQSPVFKERAIALRIFAAIVCWIIIAIRTL